MKACRANLFGLDFQYALVKDPGEEEEEEEGEEERNRVD